MEPVIAEGARKHGIADEDMLHAFRNTISIWPAENDMTMHVGPSRSGHMFIEVGVVEGEESDVILHAMKARPKFLR